LDASMCLPSSRACMVLFAVKPLRHSALWDQMNGSLCGGRSLLPFFGRAAMGPTGLPLHRPWKGRLPS
jgi:hypothetical protein